MADERAELIERLEALIEDTEWSDIIDLSPEDAKTILALLKEQEPVKPINNYGTFRCGKCRNIVGYNDGHGRGYQNNFCSKCGHEVKWDA